MSLIVELSEVNLVKSVFDKSGREITFGATYIKLILENMEKTKPNPPCPINFNVWMS